MCSPLADQPQDVGKSLRRGVFGIRAEDDWDGNGGRQGAQNRLQCEPASPHGTKLIGQGRNTTSWCPPLPLRASK